MVNTGWRHAPGEISQRRAIKTEQIGPYISDIPMKIENSIYLDHQATTPVDARVLAEMTPYFREYFGNPHSTDHSFGWKCAAAVENATQKLARLLGVDADEIVFTSGATESNNLALLGLGRRAANGKRRRILLSAIEHKCVLAAGRILQEQHGYTVEAIPVGSEGLLDLGALEEMLDDDVLAVAVIAVNNEIGVIQDIAKISRLVRDCGAIFHSDAAQAPVAMQLDGTGSYVDMLTLSAHKMYGPKGIGVAVISRQLQGQIEPLVYGGFQQNGLRSGTLPAPLCVGMGAAADLLSTDEAEQRRSALRYRTETFIERLKSLPWPIAINGPTGSTRHPGNANICFKGFIAHDILGVLQPRLAASTGSACTSGMPEPSHVLRAIGLSREEAESSIRFSLGFDTSDEDVDNAVELIQEALQRLKTITV